MSKLASKGLLFTPTTATSYFSSQVAYNLSSGITIFLGIISILSMALVD